MKTTYFSYGDKEIEFLSAKDKELAKAMQKIGKIEREINPDIFSCLINSIVSQQISSKAAQTVWTRILDKVYEATPQNIAKVSEETLRSCGISAKKAGYIKAAAHSAISGEIDFASLSKRGDEEIIAMLTQLAGVGRWTVEMLLIFSLERKDVLAYDDFGVRKGICLLYGLNSITKKEFAVYKEQFSPYGSIAAFYFWAITAGAEFK